MDIICHALVFAQMDNAHAWSGHACNITDQPDKVFLKYLKGGMLVDVVTGFPVQWLIMGMYSPCESSKDIGNMDTEGVWNGQEGGGQGEEGREGEGGRKGEEGRCLYLDMPRCVS